MSGPLVLLPPSEGKRVGGSVGTGRDVFSAALGALRGEVHGVLRELLHADEAVLSRVLGVRGALLERAKEATLELLESRAMLLPAWQRYTGVVWTHLEAQSLSAAKRRRILVPSGLYGLNRADDEIADYRLKMAARLGAQKLSAMWREQVSHLVAEHARSVRVYDMLAQEHRAALDPALVGATLVRVDFVESTGSRAVGHASKAVKGALARHVLERGDVEGFQWRGWSTRVEDARIAVVPGA